jgi:hypothetical protein
VAQLSSRTPNPAGAAGPSGKPLQRTAEVPRDRVRLFRALSKQGVDMSEQRKPRGQWLLFAVLVAAAWLLVGSAVWPLFTGR